jgi:hypothetical protein
MPNGQPKITSMTTTTTMKTTYEPAKMEELLKLMIEEWGAKSETKYSRTTDGRILIASMTCLVLSIGFAFLSKYSRIPRVHVATACYILLGLGQLGCIVLTIRNVIAAVKLFPQPFLSARGSDIKRDYALLERLREYPAPVLEYAAERLVLEADQLRSRLGMLIGVVDKVGIIPMTVGTVVSSYKFVAEANVRPSYIAIAAATVGVAYLFGMLLTGTSHRVDQLAQLTKLALPETK